MTAPTCYRMEGQAVCSNGPDCPNCRERIGSALPLRERVHTPPTVPDPRWKASP